MSEVSLCITVLESDREVTDQVKWAVYERVKPVVFHVVGVWVERFPTTCNGLEVFSHREGSVEAVGNYFLGG